MKYVSDSNLSRFFQKLKGIFAKKSEVPSQADLDARYLQLSGGTMTGNITLTGHSIMAGGYDVITAGNGVNAQPMLGNTGINANLVLRTKAGNSILHQTGDGNTIVLDSGNTSANPTLAGTEAALESIKINGTSYKNQPASVQYSTTAPTADNTDGLKIVVLSSESGVTKQSGYLYIFTGA